jgi:serine/threonine-protein kinase RsbW
MTSAKKVTKKAGKKFELVCQSDPKEIVAIENFLMNIGKQNKIDDGTMYRLLVCCTEAVNNAIIHGNHSDPSKKVLMNCTVVGKNLKIKVKDEGEGFDSSSLPDPRDEKNLLKENGRGVFLMRSLMHSVKFKKLKKGTIVEMIMKL